MNFSDQDTFSKTPSFPKSYTSNTESGAEHRHEAMQQLEQALDEGDLYSARMAFAVLKETPQGSTPTLYKNLGRYETGKVHRGSSRTASSR